MSFIDLVTSRFTFGPRFTDPQQSTSLGGSDQFSPIETITLPSINDFLPWLAAQLNAPTSDDLLVMSRLMQVTLPITFTKPDGTSTIEMRGLNDLYTSSEELWAIFASDTSPGLAESRRPADEVAAARWIRAAFSPWQIQEVMVNFWHNHFSVDAYQTSAISAMWPIYDQIIRANTLGNFRALLGAVAKSVSMMYYLNQNASIASHPNENYAREVMELHTLGIGRYLGETTPPGAVGMGYSDQDVTNAARVLTGWTIADGRHKAADGTFPNTGDFLFSPSMHDAGEKVILGQTYPAGGGQAEGERLLDALAGHPGTALTIATKLFVRFVQDTPPANSALIQSMAQIFQQNIESPNQILLVLETLIGSAEFAASAGQKVKTPFEFLISAMRATGAEVNPQPVLRNMLDSMGAPLFHWPAPNGMPDIAPVWTGTNGMIRRWSLADQIMASHTGVLLNGDQAIFSAMAAGIKNPSDAVYKLAAAILGSAATTTSFAALLDYAASAEVLGAPGAMSNPGRLDDGLRRLVGAIVATPEFQTR